MLDAPGTKPFFDPAYGRWARVAKRYLHGKNVANAAEKFDWDVDSRLNTTPNWGPQSKIVFETLRLCVPVLYSHLSFVGNSSALGMLEVLTCAYRIIFVDHVLQGCRATALVSLTLSKQPWAWNGELGCELGNRRCISPELSMQFQNHFSSLSPSLSADHVIHYILNRCTKVDRVSAKYIMMYLTALYVLELFELGWSAERNVLHTFSESYSSTRRPSSDRPRNQFPYATIWMMIFSWCVSQI